MKRHRLLIFAAVAASAIAAAAFAAPLFGADNGTGALANFTPGTTKIVHSGYTIPEPGHYSDIGRLTLPVGSWEITAHTVVQAQSSAPTATAVECYITAPNAQAGYAATDVGPTKGSDIGELTATTVSTAPNGGTADLLCRVNAADSKLVYARATSVIAVSVDGSTVTFNPAPELNF
jgi:hypothetical protein